MNFNTTVILDVAMHKNNVVTLTQGDLDAVRSVILGNLDAILARRVEAQVASLWEVPIIRDGKPLEYNGEEARPGRIANAQFHKAMQVVETCYAFDAAFASSLGSAMKVYERKMANLARKAENHDLVAFMQQQFILFHDYLDIK